MLFGFYWEIRVKGQCSILPVCISSINLYKILFNVAKKKEKITLSELTNAAPALEQVVVFSL